MSRKRRHSPLPVLISLIVVVLITLIGLYVFQKTSTNDTEMDKSVYFGLTSENEVPLIVDDTRLEVDGVLHEDSVYIDYDTVWSYLNKSIYYEEATSRLLLTMPTGVTTYTADDGSGVFYQEGDTIYVSAAFIQENSDIDMEILSDPTRVVIRTTWDNLITEVITEDTEVRVTGTQKAQILTRLSADDVVVLLENGDEWCLVSTSDGYEGYVKKSCMEIVEGALTHTTDEKFEYERISLDYTVCMAWMYVQNLEGNDQLATLTADATGLNTISPTWFSIADSTGALTSYATADYVNQAHELGLQVWGALQDVSSDTSVIGEVLATYETRQYIIEQLMTICTETGMDGINVDIETITEDTAPEYLQFMKELCLAAHEQGIIISSDSYVPLYTSYYERGEQAKTVDYIVIMGYDEHTAGSDEAGSVASIDFVEQGIQDTLEEVPAEQVINAVPFYSRGWTEDVSDGSLTSEAYGMDGAQTFASEHGISLSWDAETGQNYGTVSEGTVVYSIWVEDEESIAEKMKLIQEYDLAGVAAWRLGLERSAVWSVIQEYL